MKERVIFRQTYKRHALTPGKINVTIPSLPPGSSIHRIELQADGTLESAAVTGGKLHFYEVRIVVRPPA